MPMLTVVVPMSRILDAENPFPPVLVRDRADVYRAAKRWDSPHDRSVVFGYEMVQMNPLPDVDW